MINRFGLNGRQRIRFVILALSVGCILFWAPPGEGASEEIAAGIAITKGNTQEGFPYLSGGIGSDERAVMEEWGKSYNVKLWFAEKSGPYLSNVKLVIQTAKGAELISTVTNGPWFYIQLPAGSYTVSATVNGQTKEIKRLNVPKDQSVRRTLVWELGE